MPDITYVLILLFIPVLVFVATAMWLWNNAEHIRFLWNWRENVRRIQRNTFISTLITQPDPTRVWGVDVSRWDGNVDFSVTRQKGADFAIIKCTEGTVNTAYWSENTKRACEAGLIVGSYHWLHRNSNVSCKLQAVAAWNRVKTSKPCLPLFVDFETTYYNGVQASPNYSDLDLFVTEYTRLSGEKPILYSSPGYMAACGRMSETLRNKFAGLWIANYGVSVPSLPVGWGSYLFWQFSAEGDAATLTPNDAGKKETDLNYFYGTLSQLQALAGGVVVEPPLPPMGEIEMLYKLTVLVGLNIRFGAGTNYAITVASGLKTGDIVESGLREILLDGSKWYRVDKITRAGVPVLVGIGGWASAGATGTYMRLDSAVETPTDASQQPPRSVVVTDAAGVSWEATTFTKVQ